MSHGRPTADWSRRMLTRACDELGLDPAGARLLKFTNSAVFALDDARLVLRIAGSPPVSAKASRGVAMAWWLAEHDVPAVRLVKDVPQPLDIDGHAVTTWHQVPAGGTPPTPEDLGRLLRHLHAIDDVPPGLPEWNQVASVRARLAAATSLTDDEHAFLEGRISEVEEQVRHLEPVLPPGPLHGDAHTGNLTPSPSGPVLCDFDSAAIGHREWDLLPTAVNAARYWRTASS
jgi:hypothetical protein